MLTAVFKAVHLRLIKNYVRVPDADMPDDLAAFDPDNGLLSLQESTFVAANEVVSCPPERTRARFTIAHEFGHVFLGHKRTRHRNVSGRPIERMAAPIIRDERDADRFAGAFLAPAHLIENPLLLSARSIGDRLGGLARRRPQFVSKHLSECTGERTISPDQFRTAFTGSLKMRQSAEPKSSASKRRESGARQRLKREDMPTSRVLSAATSPSCATAPA